MPPRRQAAAHAAAPAGADTSQSAPAARPGPHASPKKQVKLHRFAKAHKYDVNGARASGCCASPVQRSDAGPTRRLPDLHAQRGAGGHAGARGGRAFRDRVVLPHAGGSARAPAAGSWLPRPLARASRRRGAPAGRAADCMRCLARCASRQNTCSVRAEQASLRTLARVTAQPSSGDDFRQIYGLWVYAFGLNVRGPHANARGVRRCPPLALTRSLRCVARGPTVYADRIGAVQHRGLRHKTAYRVAAADRPRLHLCDDRGAFEMHVSAGIAQVSYAWRSAHRRGATHHACCS